MVAKKCGGAALGQFLKFMCGSSLPIAEMLQPIVHNKLHKRATNDADTAWQAELRERLAELRGSGGPSQQQPQPQQQQQQLVTDGVRLAVAHHFAQIRALHHELQLLKEDFANRNLGKQYSIPKRVNRIF